MWNFSKFPAIIGMGNESTRTPATAHIAPNNLPRPVEWKLSVVCTYGYEFVKPDAGDISPYPTVVIVTTTQ